MHSRVIGILSAGFFLVSTSSEKKRETQHPNAINHFDPDYSYCASRLGDFSEAYFVTQNVRMGAVAGALLLLDFSVKKKPAHGSTRGRWPLARALRRLARTRST
jgi:hypothetical protein